MTLVTVPQVNPNDEVTALSVNQGANAVAAVVNGNLDDSNISTLSGSKITGGTIPSTAFNVATNPETREDELMGDIVVSGLIWTVTSGLTGAMTSGVAYVDGKRLVVPAVASYVFTASRDTYVYIDNTGSVQYNPQTTGAIQPATPAGYTLIAKVITNATNITSIYDVRTTSQASAWKTWTPIWSNLTVGNGVTIAYWTQIGKTVICNIGFTLGTTSAIGSQPNFTLPVLAASRYTGSSSQPSLGNLYIEDAGVAGYYGAIRLGSNVQASLTALGSSGSYLNNAGMTSTIPFTWGTGDFFIGTLTYEAS